MNKQQILKKIGEIIHDLNEQHHYLSKINKINILELELFTANADFLIDHIEILKKIEANALMQKEEDFLEATKTVDKEALVPIKEKKILESIAQISKVEEIEELPKKKFFDFSLDEEPAEMVFDFEKKISVEEVFDRQLSEEEKDFLDQKQSDKVEVLSQTIVELQSATEDESITEDDDGPEPFLVAKKEEEPKVELIPEPKIVAEQPKEVAPFHQEVSVKETIIKSDSYSENKSSIEPNKKLTLNEMLSNKLGNKLTNGGHVTQKQISDLKSAISLNDKMVFIKELFNGYNLAYSEAIEIINRFDNFEAADNFLQKNYAQKNDWENKKTTVDRLYDYLGRKFKN
jgi:hypothetical protein